MVFVSLVFIQMPLFSSTQTFLNFQHLCMPFVFPLPTVGLTLPVPPDFSLEVCSMRSLLLLKVIIITYFEFSVSLDKPS